MGRFPFCCLQGQSERAYLLIGQVAIAQHEPLCMQPIAQIAQAGKGLLGAVLVDFPHVLAPLAVPSL